MVGKRRFKDVAAPGASAKQEDEEDFPRGGKSTLSVSEIEEAKAQAEAEFSSETKQFRKRRKQGSVFTDPGEGGAISFTGNVPKSVELLRLKSLSVGLKIWGAVLEINKTDISISLPNGLRGFVKAEEASDFAVENSFGESSNNKKRSKEKAHLRLKELFHVGQLVACTVLNLEQTQGDGENKEMKRMVLSLLPKHFYEGLTIDRVYIGQLMVASVKSVEDHGYLLSFGLPNISGFLLHRDYNDEHKMQIGQILHGFVSAVDKNRGVVNLSLNAMQTSSNMTKEHENASLGSLLPGALVNARVQAILRNGLLLSFLTYFTGTVDMFHLEGEFPSKRWADNYTEGQRLKARILFVDMKSKTIGLSLLPHLLQHKILPSSVMIGDIFENAIVKRIDPTLGLLLELPCEHSSVPGYVHISDASDDHIEKLEKTFKEGRKVKARAIGFRLMDGLTAVSLKESVLKGLLNYFNLRAGMLVHGVVTKVEPFGAFVTLGEGVKALCPLQHMSEFNRSKPSAKFEVGAKLKFRVLQCDLQKKKISVTHKRTLVSSKLPQITSYSDAVEGLVTHGWIQGITSMGCFVEFYNFVKGLAHRTELGIDSGTPIESTFQVGQVVKCRVLKADPSSQKLGLSFLMSPRTMETSDHGIGLGSIVSAIITHMGDQEMVLQVASSKSSISATMSYQHLSDTPVHVEQMKSLLKPGYEFERLLVLENHGTRLTLSGKSSLILAADSLPSAITQLSPQAVIPGFIYAIREKACLVRFLGQLTGLVHMRNVSDGYVEDLSQVFQAGQSVRAQVLEVDLESGKFLLSLKQSACFSTNASLIENYFLEEEKIAKLKELEGGGPGMEWAESLPIGKVVEADIQEIKDYGIILNLKENADVVGFATHYQVDGQVQVGATMRARILDVVKMEGIVDLTLREKMLSTKNKQALKMHQRVEAVVELVKDEYLVLSLPDFDHAIGYASTRDYNMRMLRPHDHYTPGQRLMATIYSLGADSVAGRMLLLHADISASRPSKPLAKELVRKHKYDIGSVVQGQVVEIAPLYMTVDIGKNLRGKVHVTEVNDDYEAGNPFKKFEIGQTVTAKVLSKQKFPRTHKRKVAFELSLRPSEVTESSAGNVITRSVITFETVSAGQAVIGYIQEVTEEWAWLLLAPHLRGRLFILDSSADPTELEHFKERFKLGDAVQCHVAKVNHEKKILDLSIISSSNAENDGIDMEQIRNGDILPGRISRVYPGIGGLIVQVAANMFGKVHVTHLGDVWMDSPGTLFAEGKFVKCKVLEVKKTFNGKTALDLSLRPSLGGLGGFESLPSYQHSKRETSARIVDSLRDLKPQMEVQGFVKSVTEKGCFVALAPHIDAKILLKNLSHSYVEIPSASFPIGKLLKGRILSVEPLSGRVEMTLTSSNAGSVRDMALKPIQDFHVGDIVKGCIRRTESFGVFVNLDGCDIVGMCHISELSDEFIEDITQVYKVGQNVFVKILKVDAEKHRISLGMKSSYLKDSVYDTSSTAAVDDAEDMDEDFNYADTNEGSPDAFAASKDLLDIDVIEENNNGLETDTEETVLKSAVDPLEVVLDEETEEEMATDDNEAPQEEPKKLTKRKKKQLKEEREATIRAAEEKLLQDDQPPETVDDFEKLVRTSPNSSFVWIKYMAFLLHLADVDKARAVAERALQTINFREEGEKMNVWIAYLNLENTYGDARKEALLKLFQKALNFCDPKKLHLALLGIYERSDQHDMIDELMKAMIRKFKTSVKVWLRHMSNLLNRGLEDKARKVFDQALSSLPRHKHVKFISRCAILEFKSGSAERARSMFDGVLRNFPKRTDLWSVYLDQEIRLGDSTVVRNLFERVTCLDLAPKKMKFLFKKYLDYEKAHGDQARIEHVKAKAMEYVEAKVV